MQAQTQTPPANRSATATPAGATPTPSPVRRNRSAELAERGVTTVSDFCRLFSAMITDTILGDMTPEVTNSASNAAGKLLKAVEMQQKYGVVAPSGGIRDLTLCAETDEKAERIRQIEEQLAALKAE